MSTLPNVFFLHLHKHTKNKVSPETWLRFRPKFAQQTNNSNT